MRTGKNDKEFPYLRTIHSICYHQLGIGKDQIVRPNNLRVFGRKLGINLTGNTLDPWVEDYEQTTEAPTRDDILLQANHNGRHRKITLKEAMDALSIDIDYKYAIWFTRAYRDWKTSSGLLDYTDLLDRYVQHGLPLNVDVMFVDEAQDLSSLQWDTVFRLGGNATRWYLAGDDDQAIFHWAGADSHVFQSLEVSDIEILNQSYRVSKAVHTMAMGVLSRISRRLTKPYKPTQSEGSVANAGYLGGMDFSKKTFLLFRNHYRGSAIADVLLQERIPFIGRKSPLMNADARIALFAWYQLMKKGETSADAIKKFLRWADRDFINPDVDRLILEKKVLSSSDVFMDPLDMDRWKRVLMNLPNREVFEEYVEVNGMLKVAVPRIELMSIHQSKGREAHTVILDPEMSRATYLGMQKNPDDEHRVWYVGITRAKERVFVLLPDGQYSYKF